MPFQLQSINTANCQNANKLGLGVGMGLKIRSGICVSSGTTSVPKKSFIFFWYVRRRLVSKDVLLYYMVRYSLCFLFNQNYVYSFILFTYPI